MRKQIIFILLFSLSFLGSSQLYAADYDATGYWYIETVPVELQLGFEVPSVNTEVTITQYNNDTFYFITSTIPEIGDIFYEGVGGILGNLYSFDPALQQTISASDLDPTAPPIDFTVYLYGFQLDSADTLSGNFSVFWGVNHFGDIDFTGSRVPIPGAFFLLGSGLICLFSFTKRNKRH